MNPKKYCVECRQAFCNNPCAETAWAFLKASFDARGHVRTADFDIVNMYLQ